MKHVEPRPYADPDTAMQKLLEYANAFEPIQDGRIYIEKLNGSFLFEAKGSPAPPRRGDTKRTPGASHESAEVRKLQLIVS
jgi:hypothetical protein